MMKTPNQQITKSANKQFANSLIIRHLPAPPIVLIIRQLCGFCLTHDFSKIFRINRIFSLQTIRFASLGSKYFADMGCIPIGMRPVCLYLFYRAIMPNGIQNLVNLENLTKIVRYGKIIFKKKSL